MLTRPHVLLHPRPTGLLRPVSSEGPAHTPALPRSPPLYRTSKHTSLQRPCSVSTVLLVCRAPSLNCNSNIQICRPGPWPKSCNLQSRSMFVEFTFISSLFSLIKMNFFFLTNQILYLSILKNVFHIPLTVSPSRTSNTFRTFWLKLPRKPNSIPTCFLKCTN